MRDEVVELVRESVYITVGFGVLTFQRIQVRRREAERQVRRMVRPNPG